MFRREKQAVNENGAALQPLRRDKNRIIFRSTAPGDPWRPCRGVPRHRYASEKAHKTAVFECRFSVAQVSTQEQSTRITVSQRLTFQDMAYSTFVYGDNIPENHRKIKRLHNDSMYSRLWLLLPLMLSSIPFMIYSVVHIKIISIRSWKSGDNKVIPHLESGYLSHMDES